MKYIVILGDGMADDAISELGGKTALSYAEKPNMDFLASAGVMGMVKTVPDGMSPASDVANLSVMGYDPKNYYSGRSPLEAVSMGIKMQDTDIAVRCNLVTLSEEPDEYIRKQMIDYSADEISTEEAGELIKAVQHELGNDIFKYYAGVSYRHCMIWKNGRTGLSLTPPHDISGKEISEYLPKDTLILDMMKKSYDILKTHSINKERIKRGLHPANSIWLWGEGTKPALPLFYDKYQLSGAAISAVDLIKGIGICAGMDVPNVKNATGNINTDFTAKKDAAIAALKSGKDFVYLHIEAPDECGHRFDAKNKVRSIELIDERVVGPIIKELECFDDFSILLLPDHPTPVALGTHTRAPVPYVIYTKSKSHSNESRTYCEDEAQKTGIFIAEGHTLMDMFLEI